MGFHPINTILTLTMIRRLLQGQMETCQYMVSSCHTCHGVTMERLKMREWKMRYGQKCKGGKCRSSLAVWKAEPRLYRDTIIIIVTRSV